VFNKELSSIQVTTEDENTEGFDSAPKFNFGQGVLFSDTHHWHNSKAILPRHLGGEDTKPQTELHRRKILKSEQIFMSNLQRQAGTLTGALGASLSQLVIPPACSRVCRSKGKGDLALATKNHENVCPFSYIAIHIDDAIFRGRNPQDNRRARSPRRINFLLQINLDRRYRRKSRPAWTSHPRHGGKTRSK
jgi:hypothetical protein